MKTVLVSGCFDILHAGHLLFLRQAAALGDRLVVSVAGDESLEAHKGRFRAVPVRHTVAILSDLRFVDDVYIGYPSETPGIDFRSAAEASQPQILAVTEDDQYREAKQAFCAKWRMEYVVVPKIPPPPPIGAISTTEIRRRVTAPGWSPLRVDFAGGWLDVPKFARRDGFVVNLTITPGVSRCCWPYEKGGGLGGSAAWALLNGVNPLESELKIAGWQDAAILSETGLCVWRSGERPRLLQKVNPDFLAGLMALWWTGQPHDTAALVDAPRDYLAIQQASQVAQVNLELLNPVYLIRGLNLTYRAQVKEGMAELPSAPDCAGKKYLGAGHGGYALYLFSSPAARDRFVAEQGGLAIEPYLREVGQ